MGAWHVHVPIPLDSNNPLTDLVQARLTSFYYPFRKEVDSDTERVYRVAAHFSDVVRYDGSYHVRRAFIVD